MTRKGQRKQRKGMSRSRAPTRMRFPTIAYVDEGMTVDLSLTSCLSGCEKSLAGLPWRLVSVRAEGTVLSATGGPIQPALVQLRINDAKLGNVESVKSIRFVVGALPRSRTLRPPNPNPWKEDEERGQAIISLDNVTLGGSVTTRVMLYVELEFEFGELIFTAAKTVPVFRTEPEDDTDSLSSISVV